MGVGLAADVLIPVDAVNFVDKVAFALVDVSQENLSSQEFVRNFSVCVARTPSGDEKDVI